LSKALTDPQAAVREFAAYALGRIEAKAADAVPDLIRVLGNRHEDDKVRVKAAWALARIGAVEGAEDALPTLMEVIGDSTASHQVRERALWALRVHARLFRDTPAVRTTLTDLLAEPRTPATRMLRYDGAYLLGMVWGPEAPAKTLDVLLDFLRDDTLQIYVGTRSNTPAKERGAGAAALAKDEGMGDGRTMAVEALRRIGAEVVSPRSDLLEQLRLLATEAKNEPLRDLCKKALGEFEKK
jgi:hypothetical protein